ncbi:hypothetical protein L9F63_016892 [Diploptera punctata]|uniref:Endothelin-converting enzyme 1 n=1 Tax=Diploptera punctata TaxID=6984 RepID=A0AAD7ZZV6_DIPPU|nr:hypothetical protein L9F63_016892 [Diploptera punctata]
MDRSYDPCEDFYHYACGNWKNEHPIPDTAIDNNWFAERTFHMLRHIKGYLQQNSSESDPVPVVQARTMYKSCMDTDELDRQGLEPMFQFLQDVGMNPLPKLPSNTPGSDVEEPFNWLPIAVKTKRRIFQDLFVGFAVYPQDTNRSVYRMKLGTPDVRSPLPGSVRDVETEIDKRRRKAKMSEDEDDDPYSAAFLEYLAHSISYIYKWNNTGPFDKEFDISVKLAAISIYQLDDKLTRPYRMVMNAYDSKDKADEMEMSVEELQNWTDLSINDTSQSLKMNWTEYITLMYEDIENVTLDLNGKDKIIVTDPDYIRALAKVLSDTSKQTIDLHVFWTVIEQDANSGVVIEKIIYLSFFYLLTNECSQFLSTFCSSSVNYMMGMAVSYSLADIKFLNETKARVEEMLDDILWGFSSLVRSVTWMDEETKKATLEKAAAMKNYVGFPDWLLDKEKLEMYYEGIEMNETTYLLNMMNILQLYTTTMLLNLRRINDEDGSELILITYPTDVNAFHTFQLNAITVPAGILQFPFYGLGLQALNYGAIGTVLGHELTHGFDNSGRQYDKNGNLRQWWTNSTVEEYVNRTACFIEQYSNYKLQDIDTWVNGKLTLGENIADNGGMRESLRAYRRYVQRKGSEAMLPGVDCEQNVIIFTLFMNIWCETWTKESLRWALDDEHSPNHIRVVGVLSNSPEFSKVWKCRKGSRMNPERDKCQIW